MRSDKQKQLLKKLKETKESLGQSLNTLHPIQDLDLISHRRGSMAGLQYAILEIERINRAD